MDDLPVVAIVGRPNVGKSSLLNFLVGQRISIVDATAGVTRDRVSALLHNQDRQWELIDTGGIGLDDPTGLTSEIQAQAEIALHCADAVLFVTDGKEGAMLLDREIADRLRAVNKPTLLVVNKVDTPRWLKEIPGFYSLAMGEPLPVSVNQRKGKKEIISWLCESTPEVKSSRTKKNRAIRLALVGRRNVGKSTLTNTLFGEERVIVSDLPGTTRDAVDVPFEWRNTSFVAIDTAGMRKKRRIQDDIEYYGFTRTERSIRRADVVLHLVDAPGEISQVDKKIADEVSLQCKPCVILVNKWDLAEGVEREKFDDYIRYKLTGLHYAPVVYISALQGTHIARILKASQRLYQQAGERISTGLLNRVIGEMDKSTTMPSFRNGRGRLYYATQSSVHPPTFVLFVNRPPAFNKQFERTLANRLRKVHSFAEVPIRFYIRGHHKEDRK